MAAFVVVVDRIRPSLDAAFAADHTAAAASEPVNAARPLVQRTRNLLVLKSVCTRPVADRFILNTRVVVIVFI
jgi:hypothetical protein